MDRRRVHRLRFVCKIRPEVFKVEDEATVIESITYDDYELKIGKRQKAVRSES